MSHIAQDIKKPPTTAYSYLLYHGGISQRAGKGVRPIGLQNKYQGGSRKPLFTGNRCESRMKLCTNRCLYKRAVCFVRNSKKSPKKRRLRHAKSHHVSTRDRIVDPISIRDRPTEIEDHANLGHL
jgi:hypothetical protein